MEPLKPTVETGEFKTAAEPTRQIIPLAFKDNSPIEDELIIENVIVENEN